MKSTVSMIIATALICGVSACNQQDKTSSSQLPTKQDTIKRGEYLVATMGCGDCHSPKIMTPQGPAPDPERLLSGHRADENLGPIDTSTLKSWVLFNFNNTAVVGPWGTSYAANLTSDATGVGNWTEEQFFTALRKGKYKGLENSRPLLPPMPWQNTAQLNDGDIKAIFAYLKSTNPVDNVVPAPKAPGQL
ncbi:diheme cytochrome c-553 [Flavisolibacter tropicus]|uniref:Diheme cytochrome c-553 n=2 Tax=Flavisolibacter tropicus TaxID=1492898 RepID=A0A172U3L4_9BACT|nr:diheme cytochrome c-553 [Flavisolibacter tropicus]